MADTESFGVDAVQKNKAREILLVLVNAVSAAKLFPPDHQTVVNFISDLHQRLTGFLGEYWKLELGIEENAFTLGGENIYEDPHPAKSLPFFFFKDGMQKLYFYKGLSRDELRGFLETLREVSQLPPEEGDIVNALWERDFANIRYLAPDDFLETRIGVGRPALRPTVDRSALEHGRIELTPEDVEEVDRAIASLEKSGPEETKRDEHPGVDMALSLEASTDEERTGAIDILLQSSRQASPEDEYLNLVVELIYLEDRADQFPAVAEALEQYFQGIMGRKNFASAAGLLNTLAELRERFAKKDTAKSAWIGGILSRLRDKNILIDLQEALDPSSVKDMRGLLSYLRLFGAPAAGFLADIFERAKNAEWREKAFALLTEIGRDDVETLGSLIQESKPSLSRQIIRLFREDKNDRFITLLAKVVSYRNPAIKQAAIRALGATSNTAAHKILLGFLSDMDEDIRVDALDNLLKVEDKAVLSPICSLILDKKFARKSAREKKAAFNVLSRSDSEEACRFLAGILEKVPFLPKPRHTELCLYAVSALAGMKHPRALEVLRKCAKRRHLKIRSACLEALKKRATIPVAFTGRIPQ